MAVMGNVVIVRSPQVSDAIISLVQAGVDAAAWTTQLEVASPIKGEVGTEPLLLKGVHAAIEVNTVEENPVLPRELGIPHFIVTHWQHDDWVATAPAVSQDTRPVMNPRDRVSEMVRSWLASIAVDPPVAAELQPAIEIACYYISRLLDEIEHLRRKNAALRARLRKAEAELEQLPLLREVLISELRKSDGPNPKSSKLVAGAAAVALATITGVAAGASQQYVAGVMADQQAFVQEVNTVIAACEQVINVAETP